jgi:hypothetical protein
MPESRQVFRPVAPAWLTQPSVLDPAPLRVAAAVAERLGLTDPAAAVLGLMSPLITLAEAPEWMRRAVQAGFTRKVFHGTAAPVDFSSFRVNPESLGVHAGTAGQANARIGVISHPTHARILPLMARARQPLEVPWDLSVWYVPDDYVAALRGVPPRGALAQPPAPGPPTAAQRQLAQALEHRARRAGLTGRSLGEQAEMAGLIRRTLRDFGYDAVVYPNAWEVTEQATPNVFAEGPLRVPLDTPARLAAMRRSVMVLDPRQLRSKFARFETPASDDLLAGLAGPLAVGSLLHRLRQEGDTRGRDD